MAKDARDVNDKLDQTVLECEYHVDHRGSTTHPGKHV